MIKRLTHWLVRRTIKDHQNINHVDVRARYGTLEAWTSIGVNILLFLIKGWIGFLFGSVAVTADAFHTLSDTATSIVILFGFKAARWPADPKHPFGHGRIEAIAALVVSVLLFVTGFEVLKSAAVRIIHPSLDAGQITFWPFIILTATIAIKELLARFAHHLGKIIDSPTIEADSRHHRSDAYSTVLVLLAIVGARFGWVYLDGIMGVLVGMFILYSGYEVAKEAVSPLIGQAPDPELIQKIEAAARAFPQTQGVHEVIVHQYGQLKLVSLHLEVLDHETATALHELAEEVEQAIAKTIDAPFVVVHIDPLNKNHERYSEIETLIKQEITKDPQILSFHDLRILGHGKHIKAAFNIVLAVGLQPHQTHAVKTDLSQRLSQFQPQCRWAIKDEISLTPQLPSA